MVGFLVLGAARIDAEVAFIGEAVDRLDVHVGLLAEELGEEFAVPIGGTLDQEHAGFGIQDAEVEGGMVVG